MSLTMPLHLDATQARPIASWMFLSQTENSAPDSTLSGGPMRPRLSIISKYMDPNPLSAVCTAAHMIPTE